MKLRTGRKVGRTLYLQIEEEPSDDDILVGMVDTRQLAELIVDSVNKAGEFRGLVYGDIIRMNRIK